MDDGSARRSRRKEVVYYEDGRFFVSNRNLKTPRKTFRVARIEKLALRRDPFFICLPIIALLVAFAVRFDGYLYELVRECFDQSWQWVDGDTDMRNDWVTVSDFRIRKSMQLMKERLGDELVLDTIARDSGLSRPHFYKLFRQNIGLTPNIYLNTLRMETSINRLTQTADPITSIGLDIGFSSQASFTRFFTSNSGIAPTEYRRATTLRP